MMGDAVAPCATVLKASFQACQLYALENNERLPDADRWIDEIMLQAGMMIQCDKVSDGVGLAYNTRYSGEIIPGETEGVAPLIFDSTKMGRNEHDEVQSLPEPGRHDGKNNIMLASGQLETRAP
jgi:hypothetical protein